MCWGLQVAAIEAPAVPILGYIPRSVVVAEAALVGKSVVLYVSRSSAVAAYRALTTDLLAALGRTGAGA